MRFSKRTSLAVALLVSATGTSAFATTHARRGPTSPNLLKKRGTVKQLFKAPKTRAIDDHRATQIQQALVSKGYLSAPSGHWDSATEAAVQKLQADNGWQTKMIPDSRAIIKLGLGPSTDDQASNTTTSGPTDSTNQQ